MTLQQLEYVVALDTYRHFVTAAEHCFVTQPTITLQVKKLEDEIGIQIFNRSKSPLETTPMGKLIVEKARTIILEMNQLKEMVNNERDSISGTFKIGVIPTISPYIIPRFTGGFMKNYPDTFLDIEEMQSEIMIERIKNNTLDVGILVTPTEESSVREIPLYNEPFVYYGDNDKKEKIITTSEVEKKEGLWLLSKGHCFGNQVLNICKSTKDENTVQFKGGAIETLMRMVDNYGGFTLIPELASQYSDPDKTLYFKEPQPVREVSLIVHKGFVKEGLINALRKEILAVVPKEFEKNQRFIKVKWR